MRLILTSHFGYETAGTESIIPWEMSWSKEPIWGSIEELYIAVDKCLFKQALSLKKWLVSADKALIKI